MPNTILCLLQVLHTTLCGENKTRSTLQCMGKPRAGPSAAEHVCAPRERGETEKAPPSSTRKQLVAAPILNLLFFFFLVCLLLFLMKGVMGMSAELGMHHNQGSSALEGFHQGNHQTWWGKALPSANTGGCISPACLWQLSPSHTAMYMGLLPGWWGG